MFFLNIFSAPIQDVSTGPTAKVPSEHDERDSRLTNGSKASTEETEIEKPAEECKEPSLKSNHDKSTVTAKETQEASTQVDKEEEPPRKTGKTVEPVTTEIQKSEAPLEKVEKASNPEESKVSRSGEGVPKDAPSDHEESKPQETKEPATADSASKSEQMLVSIQEEIESVSYRNEASASERSPETSSTASEECASQGVTGSANTDSDAIVCKPTRHFEAKCYCDTCGDQCTCSGLCCVKTVSTMLIFKIIFNFTAVCNETTGILCKSYF